MPCTCVPAYLLTRDLQDATAYDMCIGEAARSLIEDKEAGLQQAGRSSAQPRSRPVSRCECQVRIEAAHANTSAITSCLYAGWLATEGANPCCAMGKQLPA
jgi:hypothetical protein